MDIVDGDNAAEIAGGQRGLMMMLLASERANERIERVARGQEHHCILRFTLCHQSPTPSPPTPLLRYFPLPLLVEAPRTLSVILELRYSDIACRRLLPPFVASSPAYYSPSSINALNGNISRPEHSHRWPARFSNISA